MAKKSDPNTEVAVLNPTQDQATSSIQQSSEHPERQTVRKLLREAIKHHSQLCDHLGNAVYSAVLIGRNLRGIEGLLPSGTHQVFVAENFCVPLGVSMRTIQRYVRLSTDFDTLTKRLRDENPDFREVDEREFLRGRSFKEARFLIRKLLSNEAVNSPEQSSTALPSPDKNDWFTPESIVKRAHDLFGVIDVDPFCIPNSNPLSATSTTSKPTNGLSAEVAWHGKVLLNPGLVGIKFGEIAERVVHEFTKGDLEEALVLLPASMNSNYAFLLRDHGRVFTNKHIHVQGPSIRQTIKVPLMLIYVGLRTPEFFRAFDDKELFDAFAPVRPE